MAICLEWYRVSLSGPPLSLEEIVIIASQRRNIWPIASEFRGSVGPIRTARGETSVIGKRASLFPDSQRQRERGWRQKRPDQSGTATLKANGRESNARGAERLAPAGNMQFYNARIGKSTTISSRAKVRYFPGELRLAWHRPKLRPR